MSTATALETADRIKVEDAPRKIWWIASFPKSGSTWLRHFVNCYVTGFPLNLQSYFQYATNDQQPQGYQQVCCLPLDQLSPREFLLLRPAMLLSAIHHAPADADVVMKTHNFRGCVEGIPLIPDALTKGAVLLLRDPRDVAISYAHHCESTIDAAIECMANNNHVGARSYGAHDWISGWSNHAATWRTSSFPVTVIRFEDMLHGDTAFRAALTTLGLTPINEQRFAYALEQTTFENMRRHEQQHGFREAKHGAFFRQGKVGGWKEVLTRDQVEQIEADHGAFMTEFGYEREVACV